VKSSNISKYIESFKMKHFICTHTFHSEETKKAYFEDNKDITSREWFASVEGEKVKCIQHWLGDQDFWFCHWIAESENQIHEKLEAIGADKLFLTMAQEMKVYATAEEADKKLYSATGNTEII
jgi:hypothetical protein